MKARGNEGRRGTISTFAMHNHDPVSTAREPFAHARHDAGDQLKGRRMVVGPRIVPYPPVHLVVRVAGALGAELPYCPLVSMLLVQKAD